MTVSLLDSINETSHIQSDTNEKNSLASRNYIMETKINAQFQHVTEMGTRSRHLKAVMQRARNVT